MSPSDYPFSLGELIVLPRAVRDRAIRVEDMTSASMPTAADSIDRGAWCLFLDRDGVINSRIMHGYVRSWEEFEFLPGALDALVTLSTWAPRIVVVTNQQGIAKGLMTPSDLSSIHARMREAVVEAGGRIDAIEVCPHMADAACACRKPQPGMALRYLSAHPELDAARSVMVGDTDSDIEMGHRLSVITGGCHTVRIGATHDVHAHETFPALAAFASTIATPTRSPRQDQSVE